MKRIIVVLMVLATFVLTSTSIAQANEPETFIKVGGETTSVSVGDSFDAAASGAAGASSECSEITLGGYLDESIASAEVLATIDEDCRITIMGISHETAPVAGASGADGNSDPDPVRYTGWAKSELNDPIRIDLAAVYVRMTYYVILEDNIVYGEDPYHKCTRFPPSGWVVRSCSSTASLSESSSIWIKGRGTFANPLITDRLLLPSHHTQTAKFTAWPTRSDYACTHVGRVGGPVHWTCRGVRNTHN